MSNFLITDTLLTQIANAIRGKDGTSAGIQVSDFPTRISAIPTGGDDLTITQATPADPWSGATFYFGPVTQGEKYWLVISPAVTISSMQARTSGTYQSFTTKFTCTRYKIYEFTAAANEEILAFLSGSFSDFSASLIQIS